MQALLKGGEMRKAGANPATPDRIRKGPKERKKKMKKVNAAALMETLTNYIYSEVPTGDFDSAEDLKDAIMETLAAMVDKVVDDEFEFEEEEEDD